MPREGKFEAFIPGNHGKWEFPLTPGWVEVILLHIMVALRSFVLHIMVVLRSFVLHIMLKNDSSLYDDYQRETRNVTAGTPSCAVLAGI